MWFPVRCQIQLQLVSLCVDRSSICSTCQTVSRTNRTCSITAAPDQLLSGLQFDTAVGAKAGYFSTDCGSNFFLKKTLCCSLGGDVWWHALKWEKCLYEHFFNKEEVQGGKMEERNTVSFSRLLSGNIKIIQIYNSNNTTLFMCVRADHLLAQNCLYILYIFCMWQLSHIQNYSTCKPFGKM